VEHQFLEISPLLVVALGAAMIFGWIFRKYKQPAVLAELIAGAILGPSVLKVLNPESDAAVQVLAYLGLIVLMFSVGLEVKLKEFIKVLRPSIIVAFIGVALPLAAGLGVFLAFGNGLMAALVVGATLTATSTGITIAVLKDLKKHQTNEARIILGAAVVDDIIGLILLSVIKEVGGGGDLEIVSVARIIGFSMLFLIAGLGGGWILGRSLERSPKLNRFLGRIAEEKEIFFPAVFVFCLALSWLAGSIGLAAFVGAFIAGLVLEHTGYSKPVEKNFEGLTALFAPLFFVSAGALFDLSVFLRFDLYPIIGALIGVAFIGKFASGIGAFGQNIRKRIVGIGMVPRGEIGLIFASFGLSAGIIAKDTYSSLLVVIIVTTFIGPLLLSILFRDKDTPAQEAGTTKGP
jgi:Kef-type K+ transport system membrane component KefB